VCADVLSRDHRCCTKVSAQIASAINMLRPKCSAPHLDLATIAESTAPSGFERRPAPECGDDCLCHGSTTDGFPEGARPLDSPRSRGLVSVIPKTVLIRHSDVHVDGYCPGTDVRKSICCTTRVGVISNSIPAWLPVGSPHFPQRLIRSFVHLFLSWPHGDLCQADPENRCVRIRCISGSGRRTAAAARM